jgi:hypothetical protein
MLTENEGRTVGLTVVDVWHLELVQLIERLARQHVDNLDIVLISKFITRGVSRLC